MQITKQDIGKDIVLEDGWAEVMEILPNESILVEYPNRRRRVILKKELERGEN